MHIIIEHKARPLPALPNPFGFKLAPLSPHKRRARPLISCKNNYQSFWKMGLLASKCLDFSDAAALLFSC